MNDWCVEYYRLRLEPFFRKLGNTIIREDDIFDEDQFLVCDQIKLVEALNKLNKNKKIYKATLGQENVYSSNFKKEEIKESCIFNHIAKNICETKTFGVEIEFASRVESEEWIGILNENSILAGGNGLWLPPDERDYSYWNVVSDSSIDVDDFDYNVEIVSPILKGSEGLLELKRVYDLLIKYNKAGVIKQNETCGTHVHLGLKHFPIKRFANFIVYSQNFMNAFVSKSRVISKRKLEESFRDELKIGPAINDHYFDEKGKLKFKHKYTNMSIRNFMKNGTVEFRQFQATFSIERVAAWLYICQMISEASKKYRKEHAIKSLNEFIRYCEIDEDIIKEGLKKKYA